MTSGPRVASGDLQGTSVEHPRGRHTWRIACGTGVMARPPEAPVARWSWVNMILAALVGLLLPLSLAGLGKACFGRRC